MNRRAFLSTSGACAWALVLPIRSTVSQESVTFGLIADAHQDIMHDAEQRLEAFVAASQSKGTDFNIQLGDFCFPIRENRNFLRIWEQYSGPKYHVLGNHDMDKSTKAATRDFWGMTSDYYSFDVGGYHFVVLDANFLNLEGTFVDYAKANFYIDDSHRTWVHPEQIEWLAEDLAGTDLPTVVFSHQGLMHDIWGVKNRTRIQKVLEAANEKAGTQKVLACFNGHNHVDSHRCINGIHYLEMNSLSYQWLGEKYQCFTRYAKEVYETRPVLSKVAPFADPLYAFVTLAAGQVRIEGRSSQWLGPSPTDLGLPHGFYATPFTPEISDRALSFG